MCCQAYERTTYGHYVFVKKFSYDNLIILLLYVDDILIVGKNIFKINRLKKKLGKSFDRKDIGVTKKILDISISCDKKEKKIWL